VQGKVAGVEVIGEPELVKNEIATEEAIKRHEATGEVLPELLNAGKKGGDEEEEPQDFTEIARKPHTAAETVNAVVEPANPPKAKRSRYKSRRRKPTIQWSLFYFP